MEEQYKHYSTDDEISLEDIVIAVRDFMREALRKWWLFGLLFICIGGYFVYRAYTTPTTYKATFTFMRNTDESGGVSGMASILGQFGFGGRRNPFNLDRVLELAKSRRVVQSTIFETLEINERDDYLANHLVAIYELDQGWANKDSEFDGFRFTSDNVDEFNDLELRALKNVYGFIVGGEKKEGLVSAEYSEESTILSLYAVTVDEILSIQLITELYENLAEYYVSKSSEKQQSTYDIVKSKADSIGYLLAKDELEYAQFQDANQNLYSNMARLKEQRLSRDIRKLNIIHAEALKNVEIADFSLRNATVVIREIDKPIRPLEPIVESKMKAILIGFLLSIILGSGIILGINFSRRIKIITNQQN